MVSLNLELGDTALDSNLAHSGLAGAAVHLVSTSVLIWGEFWKLPRLGIIIRCPPRARRESEACVPRFTLLPSLLPPYLAQHLW